MSLVDIVFVLSFFFPIAELVTGIVFYNQTGLDCSVLCPPLWLVISASVTLGYMFIVTEHRLADRDHSVRTILSFNVLFSLWFVAWSVLGGVILWAHNSTMEPQALLVIFYIAVLYRLVILFFIWLGALTGFTDYSKV